MPHVPGAVSLVGAALRRAPPNLGVSRRERRRDRAAVKRGDYSRAETLINDAEKLGVKYDPLTDRWSDSPDVLRKLLAQSGSPGCDRTETFELVASRAHDR